MFDRVRRVIAVLIAVGLAMGVYLAWPRDGDDSDDGVTLSSTTTTAVTVSTTTTTLAGTTTTTGATSHVVTTVEEAEEILRELWFGWFEGIYNQDEERIREVVVLEEMVAQARESFDVEFNRAPVPNDISFSEIELLRSDKDCMAVWRVLTLSGFRDGSSSGVEILRWTDRGWQSLVTWRFRSDLWEADCDASLSS